LIASPLKLPQCNRTPDDLDDAKGPRAYQKAVRAGQKTAEGKGKREAPTARLERVHRHHESQWLDRYQLGSVSLFGPMHPHQVEGDALAYPCSS
jgi:hypothetical protein